MSVWFYALHRCHAIALYVRAGAQVAYANVQRSTVLANNLQDYNKWLYTTEPVPGCTLWLAASVFHNAAFIIFLMPVFWSKLLIAYTGNKSLSPWQRSEILKFAQYRHFILYTVQFPSLVWVAG